MFHTSDKPQVFTSRENSSRKVLIEFDRAEHFNALISETWCPLAQRLKAAKEEACKKRVVILCETETEALNTVKYHFCITGSNFLIKENVTNHELTKETAL